VVFAVLALVYVILDFSMISPEQKRVKALKAELTRIEAEATAVQADIVIVKAQLEKDPYAKDREQLDAFKKAIQEADTFLANVESDPRQVGQLLRQILATVPGLKLVSLKTLGSTPIVEKTATAQSQATVYRRGIELTVKGNYLTMLPYLEKLQQQPIRLLWGEATLTVAAYPDADLRLLFYTVSRQKAVPLG